ncbi:hypothetical protein BG011_009199 [Mortierella polycephala]|uniref:Uncharacterized protein n=1 Tax=Mortierella polycephala TaxID=41804 RepID=A0A9P6PLQ6_9FUNG|nr:hypothetical protein BG011_009199 [Mortierella polycephala]
MLDFGKFSSSPITIILGTFVIISIIVYLYRIHSSNKRALQTNQTPPRVIPLAPITASPPFIVRTETASDPYAPPSYAHFGQDTRLSPQSTIVNIPPEVPGSTGTAYPAMVANPISPGTGRAPEPYPAMELSYQPSLYVPPSMPPTGPITSVPSQHSSTNTTPQLTPHLSATTVSSSSAVETESALQEQSSTAPPPRYLEVMSEDTAQMTATQPR